MSQSFEEFGNHILLEKLATGGMAEVYLAKKHGADGIGKLVAIKRILPQFSENQEFIEMFKDEAKIAVNLAHSNIVSIHEFGVQSNQFFLVMDLVEGRNLRQILNKMKKSGLSFSIEQVLYIIKEVAAGLDHAHRCLDATTGKPLNITHRDMSPQNVMISYEGEVKVVDFGIAKAEIQIETTRAGTLKGKFGYMSPEQAEGQVVDLRTDIFSLGIVLWELLANDRLFVANNEINTLRKIRDCQVPSLRKINPNIPQELERICNKALARDRNLRYQTAAAFHRELNRFLNRQYPDFSPHDFSVFIKTLFASEILENRKKVIDYSKIDRSTLVAPAAASTPQPAAVPVPPAAPQSHAGTQPRALALEPDNGTRTEQTVNTDSAYFSNDFNGDKVEKQNPTPAVLAQTPDQAQQRAAEQAKSTTSAGKQKPKPFGKKKNEDPLSADFAAPMELRVDPASKPPGFNSRTDNPFGNVREGTFTSTNYRTRGSYTPGLRVHETNPFIENAKSIATALTVLLVLIGGLWFAIDRQGFVDTIAAWKEKATPQPIEEPRETTATSVIKFKVPIVSTPASAEIWINGEKVKDVTPTAADFEANANYVIVIKKQGYVEARREVKFTREGEAIRVNLQRTKIAYVDISVLGRGEIYINDQKVAHAGPLKNFQIPADEDVVIRAYDPTTGASDQATIRVRENFNQRVDLVPAGSVVRQQARPQQPVQRPQQPVARPRKPSSNR